MAEPGPVPVEGKLMSGFRHSRAVACLRATFLTAGMVATCFASAEAPNAAAGPSDWIAAACPASKFRFDKNFSFPRYAQSSGQCQILGPEGAEDNVSIFIAGYASSADRAAEIADFDRLMFPVMAFATRDSPDGGVFLAFAQGYTETPSASAQSAADGLIGRLGPQGFVVHG